MARTLNNIIDIMRRAIARRNDNDADSSRSTLLEYINDFVELTMTDDVKLFENFGTLEFTIDSTVTDGVYTFNAVGATKQFSNISQEGFITLSIPPAGSVSWNELMIYQDPGTFYQKWGINNTSILIPGYPTDMLYYGEQMVFRTIPDTFYDVKIYGYTINDAFATTGDPTLAHDYWLRYVAYGAALNYARDFNFDGDKRQLLQQDFAHERKIVMTRTHNQIKVQRAAPRF
jgi:predicted ester cyclase